MIDAERLLDGPRGRELCLRAAMHAEAGACADAPDDEVDALTPLNTAEFHLNVGQPGVVYFGLVSDDPDTPPWSLQPERSEPDDLFDALVRVPVAPIDSEDLPVMLGEVVSSAKYWQPAERRDRVLAEPRFREALRPWARMIAALPATSWWADPIDRSAQLTRVIEQERVPQDEGTIREQQVRISASMRQYESESRRELDAALDRMTSGPWWSTPNHVLTTTRPWPGGRVRDVDEEVPAIVGGAVLGDDGRIHDAVGGLLVEDAYFGDGEVTWRPVVIPDDLRVLEIDSADVWVDLCRRWPLEVTASNWATWHDWTERQGRWVVPDWAEVAQRWDGVHLSLAAYLALAGATLDVDPPVGDAEVAERRATLVAGWSPDETYWFDDGVNGL